MASDSQEAVMRGNCAAHCGSGIKKSKGLVSVMRPLGLEADQGAEQTGLQRESRTFAESVVGRSSPMESVASAAPLQAARRFCIRS